MHSSNSTLVAHSYTGELLFAQLILSFSSRSIFCLLFVLYLLHLLTSLSGERERESERETHTHTQRERERETPRRCLRRQKRRV